MAGSRLNPEFSAEGTAAHELLAWCLENDKPAESRRGEFIEVPKVDPPGAHARFSFSGASQWVHCPASISATENLGDTTEKDVARARAEDPDFDPTTPYRFLVSEEMINGVQMAVDWVANYRALHPSAEVRVETKVHGSAIGLPEGGGTADVLIHLPYEEVVALDFKYGAGVFVEAFGNLQCLGYGGTAIEEYGWSDVKGVRVVIVQPRCKRPGAELIRGWHAHMDTVTREIQRMREAYAAAFTDPPPYVPGVEACKWCQVFPCAAAAEHGVELLRPGMITTADADFGDDMPDLSALVKADAVPEALITDYNDADYIAKLVWIWRHADFIRALLKGVERQLTAHAERGMRTPGVKLVESGTNRKVADPEAMIRWLTGSMKLKRKDILKPPTLRGIGDLQSLLPKDEKIIARFESKLSKPPGRPTLVIESDPRPALTFDAAAEFDSGLPVLLPGDTIPADVATHPALTTEEATPSPQADDLDDLL